MMTSEDIKGEREVEVFLQFIEKSQLPIARNTVEKRSPPEPDIFCVHDSEGELSFELVELCDSRIAKSLAKASDEYLRTSDPSAKIISKKLRRQYQCNTPIELLCYVDNRIITPDDVILPTIKPFLRSWSHVFRRAWLLGRKGVYVVWDSN